jgi:cobalt-zinc-cadmium efflux system membrane fusion protein
MNSQILHKGNLPVVLGALIVGIVGTVFVMSWGRTTTAVSSPGSESEQRHREAHEGEQAIIRLSPEAIRIAGIRVAAVRPSPMSEVLIVPGTVEVSPNRAAKITPPAPGKLVRLLANLGDTVRAGQPLAVLDSYEIAQAHAAVRQAESNVNQARAALQMAQAEVAQARANVRLAKAEVEQARTKQANAEIALQRQRELAGAGAFSQAPLQAAQQELTEAQSELLNAEKEDAAHEVVLERTERLFKAELVSKQELEQERLHHEQDHLRVERAKARLEIAKKAYEREKRIAEAGLLNAREVQAAEAEVRVAQAEVQKAQQGSSRARQELRKAEKGEQAARTAQRGAEAALNAARDNLYALAGTGHHGSLLTLSAPIGGTITERHATLGEAVERATTLFLIENLNTVMVNASVSEKDMARVRVGQPVEVMVNAYPSRSFPGVVQSIAGRIDEKTRTLPVRCLVENPGRRLKPGMFAKVSLAIGRQTSALTVPPSALEEDGERRFVYVQQEDGFKRQEVKIGRKTQTLVEITSGLKPGDRIAVEGVFVLKSEAKKEELKGHED